MTTSALFDRGHMRWYRRDPRAWWEKTKDLEPEEVGVYDRLMDLMYIHGCAMPDGWGHAGVAVFGLHANKNKAKVWKRIRQKLLDLGFIYIDAEGNLAQKRVMEELSQYRAKREQCAAAGSKNRGKRKQQSVSSADERLSSPDQAFSKAPASFEQSLSSEVKSNKIKDATQTTVSNPSALSFARIEEEDSVFEAKAPNTELGLPFANAQGSLVVVPPTNPKSMHPRTDEAIGAYNAAAGRHRWGSAETTKATQALTKRRKRVSVLLREYGFEAFAAVLADCEKDRFWLDPSFRANRGFPTWRATIDSMIADSNFVRRWDRIRDTLTDAANNDPLSAERWACEKRREHGRWVGGYTETQISATVRSEFPELFEATA